jgi:phytoene dehydrogenase-like protein
VQFRFNTRVTRIDRSGDTVTHIVAADQHLAVDGVVSNAPGIGTLTELVQPPDPALSRELKALPLQSPGVAVYMTGDAKDRVPFLRFMLRPDEPCRLFIRFDGVDPTRPRQLRLLCPTDHAWAEAAGPDGQTHYLNTVMNESWWRTGIDNVETLGTRIPVEWGRRHHLYRDSMNPVMTAKYMRRGRLPHSPSLATNLHLAGSATHPGQWVSFAAISGILAADAITRDG